MTPDLIHNRVKDNIYCYPDDGHAMPERLLPTKGSPLPRKGKVTRGSSYKITRSSDSNSEQPSLLSFNLAIIVFRHTIRLFANEAIV